MSAEMALYDQPGGFRKAMRIPVSERVGQRRRVIMSSDQPLLGARNTAIMRDAPQ